MRTRLLFQLHMMIFAAVCLFFTLAAYAKEVHVNVNDISKSAPISVTGELVFTDTGSVTMPYFMILHGSARNVSPKAVLLMAISIEIDICDSASQHAYKQDFFFTPKPLLPGDVHDIQLSFSRFGQKNGEIPEASISATATSKFVQFADGSTWGDAQAAQDTLKLRRSTLQKLSVLRKIYEDHGDQGFADELLRADGPPLPAVSYLTGIQQQGGIEAAERAAWTMLDSAQRNASATGSN